MKIWILRFFLAATTMLLLDYLWLGLLMNDFYREALGPVLRLEDGRIAPRMLPTVAIYLLMLCGILFFGYRFKTNNKTGAILYTALLGFFSFAVYDLTNWATLSHWSPMIVLADTLWGAVLFGTTRAVLALTDKPHSAL